MKNNKGLTLIEVVLTIAIIGIISIPILGIFSTGVKNIVRAGNRTEDVYVEQSLIEGQLNDYDNIERDEIEIEIKFDEGFKMDVKGKIASSSEDDIILETFVPEP